MSGNKGVVYKGAGKVAVEDIGYPDLVLKDGPVYLKPMWGANVSMASF